MLFWLSQLAPVALAAEGEITAPECFPPCSPGYLCHEGACIEACNPRCGDGFRCSAERICEPVAVQAPAPAEPADSGQGTLCIIREDGPMTKWDIEVDGVNRGIVGSNRYLCLPVSAGERTVRLVQVSGGMGWLSAMSQTPVLQLAPDVTAAVSVADGGRGALLCDVKIKATSVHLMCTPVTGPQEIDALLAQHKPERG
jgi:hypothetical protein